MHEEWLLEQGYISSALKRPHQHEMYSLPVHWSSERRAAVQARKGALAPMRAELRLLDHVATSCDQKSDERSIAKRAGEAHHRTCY